MNNLLKSPIRGYVFKFFIMLVISGFAIYKTENNFVLLVAVLMIQFVILIIGLLNLYDRFIRPLDGAIETVDELVKGNFRARIQQKTSGKMSELTNQVNALARNLSELSIHEKMQAEQLSTIVNNTESGIILIDEKGYIHYVNRKFVEMFGGTRKAYRGYLYYDVLEHEKIHEAVQETFLYERNVRASLEKKEAGQINHFQVVVAPIFDGRQLLKGAVVVLYDITELKKLDLIRKDFVANVSHELKTPITSIRGFAETLLDGALNDEKMREEFVSIIYDESNRIQYLVDDLLTLSRLEHDGFCLQKEKVSISNLVESVIPLAKQKAAEREIEFTTEVDDELTALIDAEKVKQVLINLLGNAISYTAEKGSVLLKVYEEKDLLYIEVTDTGIGIESEAIPRLFERFYRVDKARSRNTGGTGLGLAIVKHIVELHEGTIEIMSEPDQGSTFRVAFPV